MKPAVGMLAKKMLSMMILLVLMPSPAMPLTPVVSKAAAKPSSFRPRNISSSLTSIPTPHSIAVTTPIVHSFPLYHSPPRRHNVGTFSPTLCTYGSQCPQLSGANGDRNLSLNPLAATDMLIPSQRSTTTFSSKEAASETTALPFRLTIAGTAATAVAIGSMAWYYHLYGSTLYAMTPQEEGYNYRSGRQGRLY